ncbi:hypothetical protein PV328_012314, partial [Microctonus aethiopoides]
ITNKMNDANATICWKRKLKLIVELLNTIRDLDIENLVQSTIPSNGPGPSSSLPPASPTPSIPRSPPPSLPRSPTPSLPRSPTPATPSISPFFQENRPKRWARRRGRQYRTPYWLND